MSVYLSLFFLFPFSPSFRSFILFHFQYQSSDWMDLSSPFNYHSPVYLSFLPLFSPSLTLHLLLPSPWTVISFITNFLSFHLVFSFLFHFRSVRDILSGDGGCFVGSKKSRFFPSSPSSPLLLLSLPSTVLSFRSLNCAFFLRSFGI